MVSQKGNEEEEVAAAETYSQSSHEDEDMDDYEDDDDDEDDDEDEDDKDHREDVVPFWKQHWLAMAIAMMAASGGHWYNTTGVRGDGPIGIGRLLPFMEPPTHKHAYLQSYERTANVSFCLSLPPSTTITAAARLQSMDFFIPQDHYETLQVYYQADEAEDDYYDRLAQDYSTLPVQNSEFQCLLQQKQSPHGSGKFKGMTYYSRQPTLEEMYPEWAITDGSNTFVGSPGASASRQRKLQQPSLVFTGFASKFVNLSSKAVLLYWDGKGGHKNAKKLVGEIAPFESLGTATMPGHSFHITQIFDSSTALQRWVVTTDTALAYYEPQTPEEVHWDLLLSSKEPDYHAWAKYQRQLVNRAFARDYLIASKRLWLAHFPRRFPMHYLHPAEYIGQTHQRGDFRLQVVSVTPRVMVIDNFLTREECQAMIAASQKQGLTHSTLNSGATAQQTRDLSTRSSTNSWLPRDTNDLTQKVYQQAATVMGLEEDVFRKVHASSPHHHSIAESLQVVRYKEGGEEYQPHHDFVYPSVNHRYQPTRFATLLMYLNDVPHGGETRFPRAVNNHDAQGLEIQPKAGRAVLFYNLLEDGNVDDLSQHGSNPTTNHEKWLANLWVWDPIIN